MLMSLSIYVVEWYFPESAKSNVSHGMASCGTTLLTIPMGPLPTPPAGIELRVVDHILETQ